MKPLLSSNQIVYSLAIAAKSKNVLKGNRRKKGKVGGTVKEVHF